MYIMSDYVAADREQLKRLDQESLIELILVLQEQLAAHQVLIQALINWRKTVATAASRRA